MNLTIHKPDIISVLSSEGFELKQKGKAFWGVCPLHSERTPSFRIDAEKQRFHCFGCGDSGDVLSFIMKHRQLSFPESLKYLGIDQNTPFKPDPVEKHKQKLLSDFQAWQQSYFLTLCNRLINLDRVKLRITNMDQVNAFAWAYYAESLWNWHIEILTGTDTAAQVSLYREVCHGE